MARGAPLTLSSLPPECVEEIMKYLDLDTLKALRLSSQNLCARCTGLRFKTFVSHQTVELTKLGLQSFRQLAVHPELGPAAKSLKIMATVYDQTRQRKVIDTWGHNLPDGSPTPSGCSREVLAEADINLAWLHAQQQRQDEWSYDEVVKSLATSLKHIGQLDRIDLEAILVQARDETRNTENSRAKWYPVWMRAARVYCITIEAIAQSGVAPKALTVYQKTPRCSVPLYDIATNRAMRDLPGFKDAGKSVEDLALSISTKVPTGATERPPRTPLACHEVSSAVASIAALGEEQVLEVEDFGGLARFLSFTPNLKALEIHLYNTLFHPVTLYHGMFESIAKETRLPLLQKCSLRGITASGDSLLQFLSNHPQITDLTMNQICLTSEEAWNAIFEHLVSRKIPPLKRLHLSTLTYGHQMIKLNLHPTWEENSKELEQNSQSQIYFVHTKEFRADEIQRGLEFRPMPTNWMQGSKGSWTWIQSLNTEYGPPWESDWGNN
ncbi:hypothetical protein N7474_006822 [Penicillium riverlandense]|uniref:uncharacterized protein n=1 Tax=Penicillium riverlandense TaxID=1903569 RepID=UPI00254673B3|nr:uncharacterized protein N7474_006822 [Penicillium riverlandense]KAJ5815045.1 hypothetical protein N7474_006822 [Penicillium riverlandense]